MDMVETFAKWVISLLVIAVLSVILYAAISESKERAKSIVHNVEAVVVSINGSDVAYLGKQRTPTAVNAVLFKVVNGSYKKQYFKLTSANNYHMSDEWVYNHSVGDTVRFEELSSQRFFTIKGE